MRIRYGNFLSADGECSLSIAKQALEAENGVPYAIRHTWTVSGQVQADTPQQVAVAYLAREAAFSRWFLEAALVDDAGNVYHRLPNAGSTTGVRVTQPVHYPAGEGAEGTTYRNYRVVLEAEYPFGPAAGGGGAGMLKSFTETITFRGGEPRRVLLELAYGVPQVHVLAAQTAYYATQSGSAVGYLAYPPIPAPVFGVVGLLSKEITHVAPRSQNGLFVDWTTTWTYQFGSPLPLRGFPNTWPAG